MMDTHKIFVQNKFKIIAKVIPPHSKVLDIGCNDGNLRNYLKYCDYHGIDFDNHLIKQLNKQGIKAKQADLNKSPLPFKNQKFDYVLLLDILEHVVNPKDLLLKSLKILKSEGKLIITLPNDYHLLNKLRFVFNKHLTEDPFAPYGHLHYFPIKSGERFLLENNLRIFKKIILPPVKPAFLPAYLKNFLANLFPQSFARDILYIMQSKS